MTTITPKERAELRRVHDLNRYAMSSPTILRLLDALEAAEAARDAAIRECPTIATDHGRAKGYADGMEIRALAAESRAAELERQRDWLAGVLGIACRSVDCPVKDESCPIPRRICGDVTPGDWAAAAADELHGKTIGDLILEAQEGKE